MAVVLLTTFENPFYGANSSSTTGNDDAAAGYMDVAGVGVTHSSKGNTSETEPHAQRHERGELGVNPEFT